MAKLELINGTREIVIEMDTAFGLGDQWVASFERAMGSLVQVVALNSLEITRISTSPHTYTYVFSDHAGRSWNQTIRFDDGLDHEPVMNFQSDYWKLSEFIRHREVRNLMIEAMQRFHLVSAKIEYAE